MLDADARFAKPAHLRTTTQQTHDASSSHRSKSSLAANPQLQRYRPTRKQKPGMGEIAVTGRNIRFFAL